MDASFIQPIGTYTDAQNGALGHRVTVGKMSYVYCKFLDAITYVVGHVCTPTATLYGVTNDRAGGTATDERFACVIPNVGLNGSSITSVPTQSQFGYGQVAGYHSALLTDGGDDIAIFDTVIVDPSVDGAVDSIAVATDTGTLLFVGIAAAADIDSADTVAAYISNSIFGM